MDERLVALGLARPVEEPVVEEPVQLARPNALVRQALVEEPVLVARPNALVRQTVSVRDGRRRRDALCELDQSGIRITGAEIALAIPWRDARSISVDRGQTIVISGVGSTAITILLDGVGEPGLAPLFARVLEEGRAGTLASPTGARHEFVLGIDRVLEGFADADDPIVPIAVGVCTVLAGLVIIAALPATVQLAARIQPAPGAFALLPRIAFFDPRTIVAAFAAAAALSVVVARTALGPAAASWARGALRGWHRNVDGVEAVARRAIARLMLAPRLAAVIAAVAVITLLPSAFARTVVDGDGVHEASGFPFVSWDHAWAELNNVVPIAVGYAERAEGFDTMLVFTDGSKVSTRGRELVGGSERALYDLARSHAR
jgi:hypothetical protein